jgi:uracil-DNA glycosylase
MHAHLHARSWRELLLDGEMIEQLRSIETRLAKELATGKKVFPKFGACFEALNRVEFGQVRVVILGQDPYHGAGQAHGLAFSVPKGQPLPPSLKNILAEVREDLHLGDESSKHGDLTTWADQGVLLLNSVLTVAEGAAHAHRGLGWEVFTDAVIAHLGKCVRPIVFMLWGKAAQRKQALITGAHHLVLTAPHPSPLSVYRGFYGCRHFSRCNEFLEARGQSLIDWSL